MRWRDAAVLASAQRVGATKIGLAGNEQYVQQRSEGGGCRNVFPVQAGNAPSPRAGRLHGARREANVWAADSIGIRENVIRSLGMIVWSGYSPGFLHPLHRIAF